MQLSFLLFLSSKWTRIVCIVIILILVIKAFLIDVDYYTATSPARKNRAFIINSTINITIVNRTTKATYSRTAIAIAALKSSARITSNRNETAIPINYDTSNANAEYASTIVSKISQQTRARDKLAFIHIGKTAGTTASKMIRLHCYRRTPGFCKMYHKKLQREKKFNIVNETQISKQVKEYYHVRKPDIEKYSSFIVTLRHPVDRMVSWFLFQHPKNKVRAARSQNNEFYQCYDEMDAMVTYGLKQLSNVTKVSRCQRAAQNCVIGKLQYCEHMYMNYQYYVGELLRKYPKKELFALRTEFFWEDWKYIDTMIGGGNISRIESHDFKKKLSVTNKTMSRLGMQNACYWLCEEIQLYKLILNQAANLNEGDRFISLKKLNETCPEENMLSLGEKCR